MHRARHASAHTLGPRTRGLLRRHALRMATSALLITAVLALPATRNGAVTASDKKTLHTSQGTTIAQLRSQASVESNRVRVAQRNKAKEPHLAQAIANMPDMQPAAATAVQGPTNLATNVGGSWNNYAFTIPSAPYASGANGPAGAVHAVQLYNGKVLIMAGSGNQWQNLQAGDFTSWVWDPTQTDQTKAWKFVPTPYDMFCAGHVIMSNGNVLVTGGTKAYPQYDSKNNLVHDWDGSKQSYIFDVASETYVQTGTMANARWYPTVVSVGGGKVLVTGGLDDTARSLGAVSHNTDTSELYDPATGKWSSLPTLDFSLSDPSTVTAAGSPGTTRTLPYYPGLTLLKGGNLFYSGASNGDNGVSPGIWNWKTGAFTRVQALPYPYQRNAAATLLLPPAQSQKVMVMGGGDFSLPTTTDTEIIDLSTQSGSLTWTKGPALSAAKMYVGAVILPDRKVFETNGASQFRQGGVHTAETYDPATNKFTVMNSPNEDRLYHSNAFLEPNGQVAVMGSQPLDGSFNMHIAIYSPPYLFKGTRPTVKGSFNQFDYSGKAMGNYTVTTAVGTTLAHAELIRPSATTHSTDPDQREVDLTVVHNSDGTYSFAAPTDDTLVPEGQYMLFVVDSNGIPSTAKWVSIGAPVAGQTACGADDTTCACCGDTPSPTPTASATPTASPTVSATPTPTPTPTSTSTASTLTLTLNSMSGWVAKLTAQSSVKSANQDVTLQLLSGSTWTKATNNVTTTAGATTFTWGGGAVTQLRAIIPATGVTSNTVTVTYGP
jgi:hypothetical protein